MIPRDLLQAILDQVPDAQVTVPRAWLLDLLNASPSTPDVAPADFTVEQLAARFGKAPSTLRTWLEAGEFPGAYKLHRSWRVPASVVESFEAAQRALAAPTPPTAQPRHHRFKAGVPLGEWRRAS